MIWIDHPKWVAAMIYLSLGWVAVAAFPELWSAIGRRPAPLLVAAGGLLYTAGAVVYATQRPNPNPAIFGYHEVFHLLRDRRRRRPLLGDRLLRPPARLTVRPSDPTVGRSRARSVASPRARARRTSGKRCRPPTRLASRCARGAVLGHLGGARSTLGEDLLARPLRTCSRARQPPGAAARPSR